MRLLILCTLFFGACQSTPDTVYYNGNIITMNDSQPIVEAIVVSKGRILALGSMQEVSSYTNNKTIMIDLSNKTLMPGFIDPHSHIFGIAMQSVFANLYPQPDGRGNSIPEIINILQEYRQDNPSLFKELGILFGFGYDDSQLEEIRHPTKFDLDVAFPDIPVYIIHQSGHLGVANTKALEQFNITAQTPDPEGGLIQRIDGSQEPNGVLEEHAHLTVFTEAAKFSPLSAVKMLSSGLDTMIRLGYTTVQEGRTGKEQVLMLKILGLLGQLPIDVVVYPDIFMAPKEALHPSKKYHGRFRVGGMKLSLDGSPQGKTAWRDRPYIIPPHGHNPSYQGYPALNPTEALEKIDLAFASNVQILAHANGEAAIDLFIEGVALAEQKYGKQDRRPVLIHGQFTREDQVDRIVELGIFPSLFPLHT
ncbi:MAG: amidohydrolase, partial [Brevinema sp.]